MKDTTSNDREEHERQLIRSFFLPQRQERYLGFVANPRRRKDIISQLAHFKHLDPRWTIPVPANSRLRPELLKLLKSMGAPDKCWAISELRELDGKEVSLSEALGEILGRGIGTFLSCIPGRLAYFEDEDDAWILERKGKS